MKRDDDNVHEMPRLVESPPTAEAQMMILGYADRERFVILRRRTGYRGHIVTRWDACEFVVHPDVPVEKRRSLHDRLGRHACMIRMGFGITANAALRSCARDEVDEMPLSIDVEP